MKHRARVIVYLWLMSIMGLIFTMPPVLNAASSEVINLGNLPEEQYGLTIQNDIKHIVGFEEGEPAIGMYHPGAYQLLGTIDLSQYESVVITYSCDEGTGERADGNPLFLALTTNGPVQDRSSGAFLEGSNIVGQANLIPVPSGWQQKALIIDIGAEYKDYDGNIYLALNHATTDGIIITKIEFLKPRIDISGNMDLYTLFARGLKGNVSFRTVSWIDQAADGIEYSLRGQYLSLGEIDLDKYNSVTITYSSDHSAIYENGGQQTIFALTTDGAVQDGEGAAVKSNILGQSNPLTPPEISWNLKQVTFSLAGAGETELYLAMNRVLNHADPTPYVDGLYVTGIRFSKAVQSKITAVDPETGIVDFTKLYGKTDGNAIFHEETEWIADAPGGGVEYYAYGTYQSLGTVDLKKYHAAIVTYACDKSANFSKEGKNAFFAITADGAVQDAEGNTIAATILGKSGALASPDTSWNLQTAAIPLSGETESELFLALYHVEENGVIVTGIKFADLMPAPTPEPEPQLEAKVTGAIDPVTGIVDLTKLNGMDGNVILRSDIDWVDGVSHGLLYSIGGYHSLGQIDLDQYNMAIITYSSDRNALFTENGRNSYFALTTTGAVQEDTGNAVSSANILGKGSITPPEVSWELKQIRIPLTGQGEQEIFLALYNIGKEDGVLVTRIQFVKTDHVETGDVLPEMGLVCMALILTAGTGYRLWKKRLQ